MKRLTAYPLIYALIVLLLWLGPFFWTGWTKRSVPVLPTILSFQHNAAGLFTNRSSRWWDHHLEVQGADDVRHELNERQVFGMGAFGFRTRYDRILNESDRCWRSQQIRQRLAEYVTARALTGEAPADGGPDFSGAKALRLVRTSWLVGSPELAEPEGSWNPPPVTQAPPANRLVLGTYQLVSGKVIEVRRKPPTPVAPIRPPLPGPVGPSSPPPKARAPGGGLPEANRGAP